MNGLATWVEKIAALFLAIITVLVFISASARYLSNSPIPDAHAFASLFLGIALLWGLASASWRDEHIAVDLLYMTFPPGVKRLLDIVSTILLLIFCLLFCWMFWQQVQSVQDSGQVTVDTRLPIWPFYFLAWLGVLATCALVFARLWLLFIKSDNLPEPANVADNSDANTGDSA